MNINPHYKIISRENLINEDIAIFARMLKKQGKVNGDLLSKAERCKFICIAYLDDKPVAIGGIKPKTKSDFYEKKANITELEDKFTWELGYLYTDEIFNGLGIGSKMVENLINKFGDNNLMASTEIIENPKMVNILTKNGFEIFGQTWKSSIHNNELGLFLKFK